VIIGEIRVSLLIRVHQWLDAFSVATPLRFVLSVILSLKAFAASANVFQPLPQVRFVIIGEIRVSLLIRVHQSRDCGIRG